MLQAGLSEKFTVERKHRVLNFQNGKFEFLLPFLRGKIKKDRNFRIPAKIRSKFHSKFCQSLKLLSVSNTESRGNLNSTRFEFQEKLEDEIYKFEYYFILQGE